MFRSLFLLALICCLSVTVLAVRKSDGDKCHALAMSGGGDKGAYEAGVLQGLVANLSPEEVEWDVITGISAGSILAAVSSRYAVGDELNMTNFIVDKVTSLTPQSVYREWADGGIIAGLLKHSSLFDNQPLRDFITEAIGNQSTTDRRVIIGATDLNTGELQLFNEDDVINGAVASAAIPGILTAQTYNGNTYTDGGTKYDVNMFSAIDACRAKGFSDDDIVLDVVSCSHHKLPKPSKNPAKMTTTDIWLRIRELNTWDKEAYDVDAIRAAFPDVEYRYMIWPSQHIPGSGFDFNHTAMMNMVKLGNQDAINAISEGSGAGFDKASAIRQGEIYVNPRKILKSDL